MFETAPESVGEDAAGAEPTALAPLAGAGQPAAGDQSIDQDCGSDPTDATTRATPLHPRKAQDTGRNPMIPRLPFCPYINTERIRSYALASFRASFVTQKAASLDGDAEHMGRRHGAPLPVDVAPPAHGAP
jgi:hypothetical protein